MQEIETFHGDIIHVLAFDGPPGDAAALAADAGRLGDMLEATVQEGRVQSVDPGTLSGLGLAAYLIEGEGASQSAVSAEADHLNSIRQPVLVILPRAVSGPFEARPPLWHVGTYPLESAARPGPPLTSPSAEGLVTGAPPVETAARGNRRAAGYVALVALLVAFLVTLVVWVVSL